MTTAGTLETVSENCSHSGVQGVYRHASASTGTQMTFSVFVPPHEDGAKLRQAGQRGQHVAILRAELAPFGADADLVIWDPDETRTIRDEDALSNIGFSIHAGREVTGWPIVTIRRGEVVYENGRVTGRAGSGRLAPRRRWKPPILN